MNGRPIALAVTVASALVAGATAVLVATGAAGASLAYLAAAAAVLAIAGSFALDSQRQEALSAVEAHAEAEAKASLEVQSQRSALDALADGLDTVIFLVNGEHTVEFANLSAGSWFRVEEPEGRKLLAVTFSQQLEDLIHEATRDGQAMRQVINFSHPSDWIGSVQAWPLGKAERVFVAITDVTQIHRLEAVRRDFVANVSHEVRTPLSMIRLSAESLVDEDRSATASNRHLERIVSEVDRLTRITDDLLVLSGAETRGSSREPVNLSEVVARVVSDLAGVAKRKGLSLGNTNQDGVHVLGDAVQLSQVASNLIGNAIAYTQQGEVMIRVAAEDGLAVLQVQDTGIGIASEHVPRIFERFYRVDRARSRETGGTGLGLSIVRNIAEAHGGTVTVATELNRGSTFTVSLPLHEPSLE
ncbi:MAG: PAS domain-containing sensor histidine kinase [Fimbriimonadaceae bacterium]|nr:PAS domain-containing sensor histidine kinase [Fimbriimonadaceae bacterium]